MCRVQLEGPIVCGRFLINALPEDVAQVFNVSEEPSLFPEPRYNIAPGQPVPVVVEDNGKRHLRAMKWGLIPSWAKDPKIGYRSINARSETVSTKPTFRSAFKRRHCIVPASGFYDWRTVGKQKLPTLFKPTSSLFGLAGLWETWPGDGTPIDTFTILTTDANETVTPTHDRMPVILDPSNYATWLDAAKSADGSLLRPFPADAMTATPVSTYVNSAQHQGPQCIEPVESTP
jgi:putative SOS response-associated peptidase YedK